MKGTKYKRLPCSLVGTVFWIFISNTLGMGTAYAQSANAHHCAPYCVTDRNDGLGAQQELRSDLLNNRLKAIEAGSYSGPRDASKSAPGVSDGAMIAKRLQESGAISSDLSSGFANSIEQSYITKIPLGQNLSSASGAAGSLSAADCQAEEQRMIKLSEPLGKAVGMCQSARNYAKQMDLAAEFAARCSPQQVAEFRKLAADARKSAEQTCSTR